jgi:hypothetical protein
MTNVNLANEVTWEQVKSQILTAFYQSNPDERGVSAQGIDDLRKIAIAQRRSQAIAQILNYDLDGDDKVTKEEIIAVMEPRARQMIQAHGVQLEPTPEQVRIQLDKLVNDTRRVSLASPAGRNSMSSRPTQRRHAGPGVSIIRRSPVPPHRWHVHSLFNGWTTTSSGARLSFSARRSRFVSESSGDTQCVRYDASISASPLRLKRSARCCGVRST